MTEPGLSCMAKKRGTVAATILLVDANVSNLSNWEALLQHYGYNVAAAIDGFEALEACSRIQPDLVLMADLLPGMVRHGSLPPT